MKRYQSQMTIRETQIAIIFYSHVLFSRVSLLLQRCSRLALVALPCRSEGRRLSLFQLLPQLLEPQREIGGTCLRLPKQGVAPVHTHKQQT